MIQAGKSIRTFIGSKNYAESCRFYETLGFVIRHHREGFAYVEISPGIGFYLQDYYVKEWLENSMVFLEVQDLDDYWQKVDALALPQKFPGVKLSKIQSNDWGDEFFLHDPAGVLWHFGVFKS
jgi:catechol 2,3-dioxygenase-like lactoylglutathione lyase family enzyme